MTRPGLYVDGKYFAYRHYQAQARARHLAVLYNRDVDVVEYDSLGCRRIVYAALVKPAHTGVV